MINVGKNNSKVLTVSANVIKRDGVVIFKSITKQKFDELYNLSMFLEKNPEFTVEERTWLCLDMNHYNEIRYGTALAYLDAMGETDPSYSWVEERLMMIGAK